MSAENEEKVKVHLDDGWFFEKNDQWKGLCCGLQVKEVLHDEHSKYQHVVVLDTVSFGKVLLLDGVIQITERDEAAYQEMISHLPLFSHPNPKSVLIVGGGDGGVIREVAKHACVEEIVICEIDQMVIDMGIKYFPSVSSAWTDKRVTLNCGDAVHYIKEQTNKFDVIICDSSDPVGPAEFLFCSQFYQDMHKALKPGGRCSTQAESMWLHLPLIQDLITSCSTKFAHVEYATTQIPTYPAGQIGLLQCQKQGDSQVPSATPKVAVRQPEATMSLKYYSTELHQASFVLPLFLRDAIEKARAAVAEEGKAQ
mmetsp:Transcript_46818/g.92137  ORF Transcript_46818/g.92137 Transcript_46818/m.92137 type:complete len:311 (+) Transcript_46818:38-970(+)|eukprot:CAMPEP_0175140942 /NCGR_PEP_ID=MMETSP0087-20121206/11802_1 /TAXON_ID=136419 /ORGANISM="Unknown Unknown, Strain D1" /LENGTH=310 /DNA_ID=CAMNT_0016424247 /DNA_START=38 /DNA_END=970 /DNA_ORIENTATION=-